MAGMDSAGLVWTWLRRPPWCDGSRVRRRCGRSDRPRRRGWRRDRCRCGHVSSVSVGMDGVWGWRDPWVLAVVVTDAEPADPVRAAVARASTCLLRVALDMSLPLPPDHPTVTRETMSTGLGAAPPHPSTRGVLFAHCCVPPNIRASSRSASTIVADAWTTLHRRDVARSRRMCSTISRARLTASSPQTSIGTTPGGLDMW